MEIARNGSRPSGKGLAEWFAGTMRIDPLFEAPDPARVRSASVTFKPGGWYDAFLWSALQHYRGMRQRGGTAHARRNQRLIIGPWTHMNFSGSFPEREFGATASSDAIDLTGIQLRWFDRWLKELKQPISTNRPSTVLFMMPRIRHV